jgi:ATP-binding protein involved in chromosome partitioning
MTLSQKAHVDGAVVVSTPQDVALLDARKGIDMFNQMNVPIIGLIENMSTHICSNCGHEEHIFGHGGVAAEAAKLGVPIVGLIENMSTHICSNCGHEEHIFGHGGVAAEAAKLGVPLLAEIPLHLDIRKAADGGAPIVVSKPDSAQAGAFRDLARTLVAAGKA